MKGFEKPLWRWINPTLSAVVLIGCLMIGHPAMAVVTAPDSASGAQVQPLPSVPESLMPEKERAFIRNSSVAHAQSTRSSMADVLHAALGSALAAAWLLGGAWVGMRSTRISTPRDRSAVRTRNAHSVR
jgi:hypothetical protein